MGGIVIYEILVDLKGPIAERLFGCNEVLVRAKLLLQVDGVCLAESDGDIGYFHIVLDAHQVLRSDVLATESLYLGDEAIKVLPQDAVTGLELIAQKTVSETARTMRADGAVRLLAKGKPAKQLVKQHLHAKCPIGAGQRAGQLAT